MQVQMEDLSTVKKILHIEIPADQVAGEIDSAFNDLRKTATIKGFRPGKAPRSVLERMYKKDVYADVASRLIQETFEKAVRENDLKIVGQPKIDSTEMEKEQPYKFDATVEVTPEISNIDFKGLKLRKNIYRVMDHEIEGQLKMLQQNMARLEKIETERAVEDGDYVIVDYEGFLNDKPFEPLRKTENYTMKIGQGQIEKTVDEQLVGVMPGEEKRMDVSFPFDHANKTLAGVRAEIRVDVKEIRKEVLPEIDDELAKNFGEIQTLEELRGLIVKNLEKGYEDRTTQEMREQVYSSLIDRTDFELPETLIEFELQGIIEEYERSLDYHNMTLEQTGKTKEQLREEYRDAAEKQVRRFLILSRIIEQEELSLADEELAEALAQVSASSGLPPEEVKRYYQDSPDKFADLHHTMLSRKALDLIIENGEITEVEVDTNQAEASAPESPDAESAEADEPKAD